MMPLNNESLAIVFHHLSSEDYAQILNPTKLETLYKEGLFISFIRV